MLLARDKKEVCRATLSNSSKAFDCISHNPRIAKLHAYGSDRNALNVIHYYLSARSQKIKVESSFSGFLDMIYGVLQGSTLGPILFNLDFHNLLLSE